MKIVDQDMFLYSTRVTRAVKGLIHNVFFFNSFPDKGNDKSDIFTHKSCEPNHHAVLSPKPILADTTPRP
jgi:hypothetical protein